MSFLGGLAASIGGGIMDLGGDWLGNRFISQPNASRAYSRSQEASALAWDRSQAAFTRSYDAYKSRYQDTMADMKKAGLNPILAAGSGGFNVGSAPQMQNVAPARSFLPVVKDHRFSSSGKNIAETGKAIKESDKIFADTKRIRQETLNTIEQISKTRAERGLITQQEKNALKMMKNIERDWWIKAQQFNKITQEGYLTAAKKNVALEQVKLIRKQTQQVMLIMEQLKKTAGVYAGPAGKIIAYLNAIMNALNLNLGVFGGIKK